MEVEKVVEFDSCNVTPFSVDALNKGREIGLQSAQDGDTSAALRAFSIYAQTLAKEHQSLPREERRSILQNQLRDSIDGLSCADPRHFEHIQCSHLNETCLAVTGSDQTELAEVSKLVKEVSTILESPSSRFGAGNFVPDDYRVAQANNFIFEHVNQLGDDGRIAFVEQFNDRVAPQLHSEYGLRIAAGLYDDDKHVRVGFLPPAED